MMQEMKVGVTVQPTIFSQMGEETLLDARKKVLNTPCKKYLDAGIILGGSTDFPVVTCNPFVGMYAAVTRNTSLSGVVGPDEKITPAQALIMWTKSSAYFSHDENKMGSVEAGNFADMVIVDTDILECAPEAIKDTKVLMTMLGGKVVYTAE